MTESIFDFNAELDKLIKSNDCCDGDEDKEKWEGATKANISGNQGLGLKLSAKTR